VPVVVEITLRLEGSITAANLNEAAKDALVESFAQLIRHLVAPEMITLSVANARRRLLDVDVQFEVTTDSTDVAGQISDIAQGNLSTLSVPAGATVSSDVSVAIADHALAAFTAKYGEVQVRCTAACGSLCPRSRLGGSAYSHYSKTVLHGNGASPYTPRMDDLIPHDQIGYVASTGGMSGTLSYDGDSYNYDSEPTHHEYCSWIIEAPGEISVSFDSLNPQGNSFEVAIVMCDNCWGQDQYSGKWADFGRELIGKMTPESVSKTRVFSSSTGYLTVTFTSDGAVTARTQRDSAHTVHTAYA